jgi:hypothetical protein
VFGVTALLPLLTAGTALLVNEDRIRKTEIRSSTLMLAKEQVRHVRSNHHAQWLAQWHRYKKDCKNTMNRK